MDWQVSSEQEESSSSPEDNKAQTIVSVIELDLPNLGKVQARLTLRNNALSVHLQATQPQTETLFRQEMAELKNTLSANGQELKAMEVGKHG
jgi:flagellar hook-length control protein FliK